MMGLCNGNPICHLYEQSDDTAKHILLECAALERLRASLLRASPLGDVISKLVGKILELAEVLESETTKLGLKECIKGPCGPSVKESKCPAKHANVQDYQDVTSPLKKTSPFSSSATRNCNTLEKILIKDWKSIVNKKTLSDITIYIDKGLKIPAHKLVFYVRCPLVLKDIIKEETGENESSEMLMWLEVSHAAALAFLEYIYCSSTNKIFILKKPDLASVRKLAQRYNVRNLLPCLKMAKDLRTKSNRLSQSNEKSLEEGGYLKLKIKNGIKMHECSKSSEIADSLPSDTGNISTVFENENTCDNSGIRESPDLFRDDNENALTDTCHVKDSSSQESSKPYINFLVSLLDELPPTEDHSKFNELKFCSPEISPKLIEAINNSSFKSSKNVQNYICPNASVQNGYKEQGELKKNIGNRRKNKSIYSENQFSFSSQKTNATEHQMSANNLVKSYKKCLQKNCSPFRHSSIALPSLSDSDIESKNDQPAEIASKQLCSLEENSLKYNIEKMLLDCTETESLEKKSSEGVTESEAMDNSSRRAPEVWSNTSSDGSCLEYKRKHSESDSSLNDTFKKTKSQLTNSEQCNELKVDAMKTSASIQAIACSDMKEQLHYPVKENAVAGEQSMSNITNVTSPDKVKKLYSAKSDRVLENTKEVKNADGYNCDKEWDSFDEMCHASPTGVFSQPLMSHLANRTPLKKTEKNFKKRSLCSSQPTAVARNSFLDSLNESLFWRDENAPEANCKTPVSKRKAEYVTPPVDYNIMRTTEIKKELRKYGLKPSLTKKQARTMLQYIYDQLHPWVSNSEETSTLLSPQEKFKLLSYSSQAKQNCNAETMSKHPIRRSLLEPSQEQGETDLESEEELMLSQNSLSSTSSAQSDIIRVEEAHSDDLEENCITQEVLSSQDLHVVVHKFIVSNEDFHQKILMGEPFVINELHAALRNIGFKCKMDQLMNYLDEQCITFQTGQQHGRRRRKSSKKNINKTKCLKRKKKKGSSAC